MRTRLDCIRLASTAPIQLLDITDQVRACCAASGIRDGLVTLISRHTTAYINLNEREPQLQQDMLTYLKRLVPRDGDYLHNLAPVDDRDNAHSHLLGLFMNASETIPIADGELLLGAWQSIFFVELDGPRPERSVTLQFIGQPAPDAAPDSILAPTPNQTPAGPAGGEG
ncbi:MAG: YjbQ family protein [Chromatiaceae bacterium]|nr:MAG: YjbQ family protein [Chromatiaceae bacterium]